MVEPVNLVARKYVGEKKIIVWVIERPKAAAKFLGPKMKFFQNFQIFQVKISKFFNHFYLQMLDKTLC